MDFTSTSSTDSTPAPPLLSASPISPLQHHHFSRFISNDTDINHTYNQHQIPPMILPNLRPSYRESIRLVVRTIEGQITVVTDMLSYFTRLVKAERTVQQALDGLLPTTAHNVGYSPEWDDLNNSNINRWPTSQRCPTPSSASVYINGSGGSGGVFGLYKLVSTSFRRRQRDRLNIAYGDAESGKLSQVLQSLRYSTNQQARTISVRALFHKLVTVGQLEQLIHCHQCLKRTFLELENAMQSQSNQYANTIKTHEKKYVKYSEQYASLRCRLNSAYDKRIPYGRKPIETLLNDLEASQRRLHLLHNDYVMALYMSNQYQHWLHTRLRPGLLIGLERTLQLAGEVVWHLLVFGGWALDGSPASPPVWLKEMQADHNLNLVLEQNGVCFPKLVHYEFNSALLDFQHRCPPSNGQMLLRPYVLAVNPLTTNSIDELIRLHHGQQADYRETIYQFSKECMHWEDALAQWRAVFATPLPNPFSQQDLGATGLVAGGGGYCPARVGSHSTGTSRSQSSCDQIMDGSTGTAIGRFVPDINDLWQDDRAKPVNLCQVSYRLTIAEFDLSSATYIAEVHSSLIQLLSDSRRGPIDEFGPLTCSPSFEIGVISRSLPSPFAGAPPNESSLGLSPDLLPLDQSMAFSSGVSVGYTSTSSIPAKSYLISTSPSSVASSNPVTTSDTRPTEHNRLWKSFRHSVSRLFVPNFSRSSPFRASISGSRSYNVIPITSPLPKVPSRNTSITDHSAPQTPSTSITRPTTGSSGNNDATPRTSSPAADPGVSTVLVSARQQMMQEDSDHYSVSSKDTNTNNTSSHSQSGSPTFKVESDINKEPWFHGVLPRAEVERLLQKDGDFLVRQTTKPARETANPWRHLTSNQAPVSEETLLEENDDSPRHHRRQVTGDTSSSSSSTPPPPTSSQPAQGSDGTVAMRMVLSVQWNGPKHFLLCGGGSGEGLVGGWHLEGGQFPTVRDLIDYHMLTGAPVTARSGALLINPITRPNWELNNADVKLVQKIGHGNFGNVYRGYYNGREVAVKTCRVNLNASDVRQKFLQGETTALQFCHPHVVQLIGVAVCSYPIMIVMEYLAGGCLLNHLRQSRNALSLDTLLLMASDAASGMAYLESKNCIHRDVAARNCLLTRTGRLKIADFGMSREENVYELSDRRGQIPIKWTSPEALATAVYTIKCDVWSYGVLLWEIFSYGDVPYRTWSNPQTREMVESGYRLPAPQLMPSSVRTQMTNCWHADPLSRPSFAQLFEALRVPSPVETTSPYFESNQTQVTLTIKDRRLRPAV